LVTAPAEIIRVAASTFAERTALLEVACAADGEVREGRAITYRALGESLARFCSALARDGLSKGDRIAVLLDNCIELVVTEWACLTAGYVWVALNARSSAAEVHAILEDSRPALLVVDPRYEPLLPAARVGCRVVRVGPEWDAWLEHAEAATPRSEPRAGDPVRLRYTSGTAGKPKGAVLPRRTYDTSIEAVTAVMQPLRSDDVLLQCAPMTHAAGAMLLPHVRVGACAVLVDRFDARAFAGIVERYHATAAFLVPTMLVRVLDALDDPRRLASLRAIVYGGASMPVEPLVRGIDRLGAVFVQIYGLTESTWPVAALLREDHRRRANENDEAWRNRLASCGRPTSVGEVRIVDGAGADAPANEPGELWVRGGNTMAGYWPLGNSASRDVKGLDADGWMHTGDVAVRDAEGYLTIVDRLHDMIVSGGFNVYPREVEDALCSHPAVLEAAVVGRPSTEWGETVHAAVVLKSGRTASADELIAHCAARIAGFKKPRTIEIVERLPRNAAGKILRRALR
jgi:acyl-CoA synthetase (AMP-forming)/AMP-acid ligase II